MIARASSGSRSCSSSVEPLISANSAVTVLRSPSIASGTALSGVTVICDFGDETVAEAAALVGPIAVPHFLQNRAPGLTDALHAGQINSSLAPHPSQHEASPGLSWLQDGHRIGAPFAPVTTTPCADAGRKRIVTSRWRQLARRDCCRSPKRRSLFPFKSRRCDFERKRSEEHTSELQSRPHLVCRLLLE